MADNDGLYIRTSLQQKSASPRPGAALAESPDVICSGLNPVGDPVRDYSLTFDQYVTTPLRANAPNFIYMRGGNAADGPRNGTAQAYACPSNLLLFPDLWRDYPLRSSSGSESIAVTSAGSGQPWVTPEPFVYTPAVLPAGMQTCLIGHIVDEGERDPIPRVRTVSELATWLARDPGIAAFNSIFIQPAAPGVTFTSRYFQGDEGGLIDFLVQCTGAVGGEVWFTANSPLPSGEVIRIPATKITQSPQTWGTQAMIPAGWDTTFTFGYRSNGAPMGRDFRLSVMISLSPPASASGPVRAMQAGGMSVLMAR